MEFMILEFRVTLKSTLSHYLPDCLTCKMTIMRDSEKNHILYELKYNFIKNVKIVHMCDFVTSINITKTLIFGINKRSSQ